MSREPNRKKRASESRLMEVDFDRIERSGCFFFDLPMSSFKKTSNTTTITPRAAAINHSALS